MYDMTFCLTICRRKVDIWYDILFDYLSEYKLMYGITFCLSIYRSAS